MSSVPKQDDFSLDGLRRASFSEPVPFETIRRTDVLGPRGSADFEGVYIVSHQPCPLPSFLPQDHPKRSEFTLDEELAARWIESATVLYIGKAPFRKVHPKTGRRSGLWGRIREYRNFIYRSGTNHAGGEDLRRLPDRNEFLICWRQVVDPGVEERRLIADFRRVYEDMRPFGNRQDH